MTDWRGRLSDADLVARAQGGDQACASTLTTRYQFLVRGVASRYWRAGRDWGDAVSIGLEGLADAIRCYRAARGASFHTFAKMCIQREFVTWVITSTYPRHRFSAGIHCHTDNIETFAPADTASTTMANDLMQWLREVCSPFECGVMEMFLAGHTYPEIAQHYGVMEKSVDNALSRVRRKAAHARAEGSIGGDRMELRCSVCQACGKPFREPAAGPRHEFCQSCGCWKPPKPPRAPGPLWSSVHPVHVLAEAGARGQHGGGRYPGTGVVGSTPICDGLR